MIVTRACDVCLKTMPHRIVRLEVVQGQPTMRMGRRPFVRSRPGGTRVRMLCQDCADYLISAVDHLRRQQEAKSAERPPPVVARSAEQRRVAG